MSRETWAMRERVILAAIAIAEDDGTYPDMQEVMKRTGLSASQVELGLRALLDGNYIQGTDATTFGGFDLLAIRLLPMGRRAIGQWPGPLGEPKTTRQRSNPS